jgi:cytoskeletal protein CcmA (bactofilin family)
MKYVKMLGLLAVAAAALMAFAGTASATLTGGTTITAESSSTQLTGSLTVTCTESEVHGDITSNGADHVEGSISTLTFENCGGDTVDVLAEGSLTLTDSGGTTGTVTSTGASVTILTHRPFLGTIHCIYDTNNTHIGTYTESHHNPGGGAHETATIHANSVNLTRTTTSFGCGTHSTWDGTYAVVSPMTQELH